MSLVKFSHSPMSSFLDDFFTAEWPSTRSFISTSQPAVNVKEQEKEFVITLAAPGRNKNDFKVDVEKDILSISATSEEEAISPEDHYTRREFNASSFKRSFTLPESVETSKIKAKYQEGILTILLPKRKEALPQSAKRIAIE